MATWWAPALEPRLSQGDIFVEAPFAPLAHPLTPLSKASARGTVMWEVSPSWTADEQGLGHALARGRLCAGIVISHSCDLDKRERKGRVVTAPVHSTNLLEPDVRQRIMEQRRLSLMPLPDVPSLGECYADLRLIMAMDRRSVERAQRVASMSEAGTTRLHAQVVGFFTRRDLGLSS